MHRGTVVIATFACLLLASSACNDGKCGPGTLRYGDTCVLHDPFDKTPPVITIDPPLYTRQVGTVTISTDKPATIYYTLDGTTPTTDSKSGADEVVLPNLPDDTVLSTFAVDLAGNKSDTLVRVWVIDRDGPGAPLDLHVALAADLATRTVTWGMPADPRPGGVLVARIDGKLGQGPVSGQTYQPGDMLAAGMTVVAVSGPDPTGTFSESLPAGPGLVRYAAWAFDSLENYSPPSADYTIVPMPAQTATVAVDQATGNVTITKAPSLLGLDGTATVDTTAQTLTLTLTLKNTIARVLFAPKLELTSTLPTGVTFTGSGTLDNVPYQAFGSALNPSASSKAQLTFSGVAATGTLSLAFTFRDDPVLTTSVQDIGPPVIDSATGQDLLDMPEGPLGKDGDNSRTTTTAFTPDGTMIVAQRNSCQVISYSASSGRQLASAHLGADLGQVPWLVTDHGGTTVYAAVSDFRPKTREHPVATDTQIVRLDATTLAEYPPRLSIGSSLTRSMMLTPDDRRLIVATAVTSQGLLVIDTTTFQIENRIIPDFKVEAAALSPDGKTIAAVGQSVVGIYDLAGRLLLKYPTPGTPGMRETHMWAAFGSSSLLWISRLQEVDSLDLRTGDSRVFTYAGGLAAVFDGKLYTHAAFSDVSRFDAATGTKETSLAFGYAGYSHWLGRSPF